MTKGTGTVYLSPSHKPFHVSRSPKTDANGSADVLYVALDPVFVGQIGEGLEIYPDRLERYCQLGKFVGVFTAQDKLLTY
jgi:hypothetical protein